MSTRLRRIDRFEPDAIDNREILRVLSSFDNGDFSVRLPSDRIGIAGKIYDTLNTVIQRNEALAQELDRVSEVVGKEGKLKHRASLDGTGSWKRCVESVNALVSDLVQPSADFSKVI